MKLTLYFLHAHLQFHEMVTKLLKFGSHKIMQKAYMNLINFLYIFCLKEPNRRRRKSMELCFVKIVNIRQSD